MVRWISLLLMVSLSAFGGELSSVVFRDGLRIGISYGSFDPPHEGHLTMMEQARQQAGLDYVIIIPLYADPTKPFRSPIHDRNNMLRLMTKNNPHLLVADDSFYNKWMADNVRQFVEKKKGQHSIEVVQIVGQDTGMRYSGMPAWVARRAIWGDKLAVVFQSDDKREAFPEKLGNTPVLRLTGGIPGSSSDIKKILLNAREAFATGQPPQALLEAMEPDVAQYVIDHNMYHPDGWRSRCSLVWKSVTDRLDRMFGDVSR